jgi:FAD/FMN-containing dehydrogenase
MAKLRATTITGVDAVLDGSAVEELGSSLRGELLRADDAGYEEARSLWNGMMDRKPALIARCAVTADVVKALDFARAHGLLVAVRGGGHGVAGSAVCDGGLVVDLSPMKGIQVDPERRTVRAGGGVTIGELDGQAQRFGLAAPMGVVSETGIAGLTLGGGIGWLRRKYGLSCDNLVSVELVTADGRLLRASETENPALFWGVRGGVGGNFGVVTSFEYRLHPVGPEVMFCFVFHDGNRTEEALRFYREYAEAAPDEVSSFAICGTIPGEEPFPEDVHGSQYVLFGALYAGGIEEGERIMRPLREFGEPLLDLSGPMPYIEVQSMLDEDYPSGQLRYYWKSLYLNGLDDEAIARIAEHAAGRPSAIATVDVWHMGGAVSRVGGDRSAFGGREAPFLLGAEANWEDPRHDEANISWARGCVEDMRRFSGGAEYLNFPGFSEGGDGTLRATFGDKYGRLVALKNEFDPTNFFRLNQNIKPTT